MSVVLRLSTTDITPNSSTVQEGCNDASVILYGSEDKIIKLLFTFSKSLSLQEKLSFDQYRKYVVEKLKIFCLTHSLLQPSISTKNEKKAKKRQEKAKVVTLSTKLNIVRSKNKNKELQLITSIEVSEV